MEFRVGANRREQQECTSQYMTVVNKVCNTPENSLAKSITVALGGFSFGAYIAQRTATAMSDIRLLISIAPPVHHFAMQALKEPACPWLIVQGDQDEIVPAAQVYEWANSFVPHPMIKRFETATHFFHGKLVELQGVLREVMQSVLIENKDINQ